MRTEDLKQWAERKTFCGFSNQTRAWLKWAAETIDRLTDERDDLQDMVRRARGND